MESSSEGFGVGRTPQSELDEVRRSAQRAHLDYPPVPLWIWPALGIAASLCAWSYSLNQPIPGIPVFWAGLGVCWWVVLRLTRARGVFPSFSTMPRPLKREAVWTWFQVALLVPVVAGVWRLAGSGPATIFAGLAFAGLMYAHQRRYDGLAAELLADSGR